MKWFGILILGGVVGCTQIVHDTTTLDASRELLRRCTELGLPKVGSTNDSLVYAFLEARRGIVVCQAVSSAVIDGNLKIKE